MTEAAFPLLGTAFVVLVVLPACALVAKAGLALMERDEVGGPLHGLDLRYVLLTGSSALPVAWLLSAAAHQTGRATLACLFEHDEAALCFDPGFFGLALAGLMVALAARVVRRHRGVAAASSEAAAKLGERLEGIVARHRSLAGLRGRLVVTDAPGFALATAGLVSPRVFVGTAFAAGLTDEMLAAALGHEQEHVRALDPLRYWILQIALGVNPFGRALLDAHAGRWLAAREAHCDREAVIGGAAPLPLANALVKAARPGPREAVALGARETSILELRVRMLLAFAEKRPVRCCRRAPSAFPVASALLLVALVLPHQTGTAALDAIHTGAEHTLTYFWR